MKIIVIKGEAEGHPFRGNQYEEGQGLYKGPPSKYSGEPSKDINGLKVPESWLVDKIEDVPNDLGFGKPYFLPPNGADIIAVAKVTREGSHEMAAVELAKLNPGAYGKKVFGPYNPWVRKTRAFDKTLEMGFIRVREHKSKGTKEPITEVVVHSLDTSKLRRIQRLVDAGKIPYTKNIFIGSMIDSKSGKTTTSSGVLRTTMEDFMQAKYVTWDDGTLSLKEAYDVQLGTPVESGTES